MARGATEVPNEITCSPPSCARTQELDGARSLKTVNCNRRPRHRPARTQAAHPGGGATRASLSLPVHPPEIPVTPHQMHSYHRSARGTRSVDLLYRPSELIAIPTLSGHSHKKTICIIYDLSNSAIQPNRVCAEPEAWRPILALTDPSGHSISHTDPSRVVILSYLSAHSA